jgi:hypothetical protein
MIKLTLIALCTFCYAVIVAQNDFLVFKKGKKSIQYFYKGSYISFQLHNKDWVKGIITKVENDSFYFTKEIIRYFFIGADTTHFSGYHYSINDIYALPKRGVQIDYMNERFNITSSGGHQHFYWIKSGWIFRAGGAGYAALNIINGLIKNDALLQGGKLGIAAGVFAGGVALKKIYKLTHRLGKKYRLETIKVAAPKLNTSIDVPFYLPLWQQLSKTN